MKGSVGTPKRKSKVWLHASLTFTLCASTFSCETAPTDRVSAKTFSLNDDLSNQTTIQIATSSSPKRPMAELKIARSISGTWTWQSKGTNWREIEAPKKGKLERQLIIKESGEIEFYENGKLIKQDHYDVKLGGEDAADKYLIILKNSKETYSLWFNEKRLSLSEPNCDCGCLTNEYLRN